MLKQHVLIVIYFILKILYLFIRSILSNNMFLLFLLHIYPVIHLYEQSFTFVLNGKQAYQIKDSEGEAKLGTYPGVYVSRSRYLYQLILSN